VDAFLAGTPHTRARTIQHFYKTSALFSLLTNTHATQCSSLAAASYSPTNWAASDTGFRFANHMSQIPKWLNYVPYRCSFCRENLKKLPLRGLDWLRLLLLLRPYHCPHCFCCSIRPFAWIGRLPILGRIFRLLL